MIRYVFVFCAVIFLIACNQESSKAPEIVRVEGTPGIESQINPDDLVKAELFIEGMTCAVGCASTIQKNLKATTGVQSAKVDFDKRLAYVEFDKTKLEVDDLKKVVTESGEAYKVTGAKSVKEFENEASSLGCCKDCGKDCCGTASEKMSCAKSCKKACGKAH